jgi:hypothetical protein
MVVWDDLKTNLGNLIGSNDVAGFILGGALTLSILVAILIATSKSRISNSEFLFFLSVGMGLILSIGFGWWPLWTALIFGLIITFMIMSPFGNKSGA